MADYIRRLVSGGKARFKDEELKLELDLVYVTDQVIIMGYPASGFEGYYRNRREDVKKFLDHRHGKNYWIFNFCPLKENSYDAAFFEGRVSRFPFPDHHAPPLAIMPLVAREIRGWLSGHPERVAVLHCKAGKGRSGTMACSYLLSLDEMPTPPRLQRSHSAKAWAKRHAQDAMNALPTDQELDKMVDTASPLLKSSSFVSAMNSNNGLKSDTSHILDPEETGSPPLVVSPGSVSSTGANSERSFTDALKGVLDLHTSQRMRAPSDPQKKIKQGVSIPSQRRYLYYWALLLAHGAPEGFWSLKSSPSLSDSGSSSSSNTPHTQNKRVRLTDIKIRTRELSSVKLGLVRAANIIIDKTKGSGSSIQGSMEEKGKRSGNPVWVSLARYDDDFVTMLEKWEKHTRDEKGRMGVQRPDSERMVTEGGHEENLSEFFGDGHWDKHKMVRSFARLGQAAGTTHTVSRGIDKDEKILTYTLRPLSEENWEGIKQDIEGAGTGSAQAKEIKSEEHNLPADEALSMYDTRPNSPSGKPAETTTHPNQECGVVLDAEREVRIKLYMGQVFMGWIWLIPTFHMPHPAPIDGTSTPEKTTVRLTRKEVDFPIGLGAGIIDAEISFEWVTGVGVRRQGDITADAGLRGEEKDIMQDVEPPALSEAAEEPTGAAATVAAILAGTSGGRPTTEGLGNEGIRRMVETKQGAED